MELDITILMNRVREEFEKEISEVVVHSLQMAGEIHKRRQFIDSIMVAFDKSHARGIVRYARDNGIVLD